MDLLWQPSLLLSDPNPTNALQNQPYAVWAALHCKPAQYRWIYNVVKVYCSASGLVGGQEGELKAGSEVNMDEEGTPALNLPYPSSSAPSLEYFSMQYDVCLCFSTDSQSNGFVALNDWQQRQQRQRLSDAGAAVWPAAQTFTLAHSIEWVLAG